jgi:uncharacterized Zn-binding protein involved in type VI secretion
MSGISRTQDLGAGECRAGHPGAAIGSPVDFTTVFISGVTTVFLNGSPVVVVGSIGETDCGHTTTAISGSNNVYAEGSPIHRLGDVGIINEGDDAGEYSVISSSDNAYSG